MNNKIKFFIFLFLIFAFITSVYGSPIIGSSANTIKGKSFMFEGHFFYNSYTKRYDFNNEEWIQFPTGHSYVSMGFLSQIYYGIFDYLTIRLSLPVLMKNRDYGTSQKSTGIGDVYFDFKHRIVEGRDFIPTISWCGGARFPTGDKDTDPQLGDGSIDGLIGLLVTEELVFLKSHISCGYWYNGKVDGNDIPDMFFYNATLEYPLPAQFAMVGEANGNVVGSGVDQKYVFELCPGLTNKSITGLILEASVKIPIKTRSELRYDYSPFVGLMYFF